MNTKLYTLKYNYQLSSHVSKRLVYQNCIMSTLADEEAECGLSREYSNLRHYWAPQEADARSTGSLFVSVAAVVCILTP